MPYIEYLVYGRPVTKDEKQRLYEGSLDAAARALGSRKSQVYVAVQEWPADACFGETSGGGDAGAGGASQGGSGEKP